MDSLGAELVNAFCFAHEHQFELVAIRVVIDELCHLLVDLVPLYRHVNGNSCLQLNYVVLQIRV